MATVIKYNLTKQIADPQSCLSEWVGDSLKQMAIDRADWSQYLDQSLRQIIAKTARDLVVEDVIKLATVAQKHGGVVYGGFVRDFIIRKGDASDIDLWFQTDAEADAFIAELVTWVGAIAGIDELEAEVAFTAELSSSSAPSDVAIAAQMYPFRRYQYLITSSYSNFSYFVDVVVSADFPVNDFVNNQVIAVVEAGQFKLLTPQRQDLSDDSIVVTSTKQAMLKPLPEFHHRIIFHDNDSRWSHTRHRLIKFLARGWTIDGLNPKGIDFDNSEVKPLEVLV